MATRRNSRIQPWLDYFDMLAQYEKCGFLEMKANKHEAYVTHSALFAMSVGDNQQEQMSRALADTVTWLRNYAVYLEGKTFRAYCAEPFAVHVVNDDAPHDLLFTVLLTRRRVWWRIWMPVDAVDDFEVIDYGDAGENSKYK